MVPPALPCVLIMPRQGHRGQTAMAALRPGYGPAGRHQPMYQAPAPFPEMRCRAGMPGWLPAV
jgi:hypothetical protein